MSPKIRRFAATRKILTFTSALSLMGLGYGAGHWTTSPRDPLTPAASLAPSAFAASANAPLASAAGAPANPSEMGNIFVNISRKTVPSVVNIFTTKNVRPRTPGSDDFGRRLFEQFFGGVPPQGGGYPVAPAPAQKAMSLGSGFIIEASNSEALVLTNNHVIDGADEVRVKFTEADTEKETEAQVVGTDPDLDIAILKVKSKQPLSAVPLGDSNRLEVGEWVAAVGNPFGHGHSVSHGIVSAKERALPGGFGQYLQVDAPINPGNSGGPLVNLNGEVVGINNAIDARATGIGFAIPINAAKEVIAQLKKDGKVERGHIGIAVEEMRPDLAAQLSADGDLRAPIITQVIPEQPAFAAGLKPYDVVTEVNSHEVHSAGELVNLIRNIPIGDKAQIKVLRSGKSMTFNVRVAKRPSNVQQS